MHLRRLKFFRGVFAVTSKGYDNYDMMVAPQFLVHNWPIIFTERPVAPGRGGGAAHEKNTALPLGSCSFRSQAAAEPLTSLSGIHTVMWDGGHSLRVSSKVSAASIIDSGASRDMHSNPAHLKQFVATLRLVMGLMQEVSEGMGRICWRQKDNASPWKIPPRL